MSWPAWNTRYVTIWDKLVGVAIAVKDDNNVTIFDPNYVFYGEKYSPDHFPSCFVCPDPVTITPVTFTKSDNVYDFEYGVVVRNTSPKQGYLDALAIIGKIYDALMADRQLTGSVDNLEALKVFPNWRNKGTGIEAFWGGLLVRVTKYGT